LSTGWYPENRRIIYLVNNPRFVRKKHLFIVSIHVLWSTWSMAQVDSLYIGKYKHTYGATGSLTQEFLSLNYQEQKKEFNFEPNRPLNIGLAFSWKNSSLSYSHGFSGMRDKEKGKSTTVDLQYHLVGRKFMVDFYFQQYKGFYRFDEDFFAHQEEIDLCWRAQNRGYRIQYCGFSTVYHVGGATLNYNNPKKTYLNFRNSLLMLYKNLPTRHKFRTIFIRLCLDGLAGVRFLFQFKPKHCWAIIRSHFAFYKRIPQNKNKIEITNINNYFTEKSIIFSYFVSRKRFFTKNHNKQ